MEYNYYQRGYNHRGFAPYPQNRSRGRGRGYSRDMDNLNPGRMYRADRRSRWDQNYGTEVRTLSHHNQNPCQSYQNQAYMNNMPCQMSAPPHVSDKVQYPKQSHENWRRMGQQDIVRLFETLAFLLRHGAEKLGFHFMPGGFLYVDQLLKDHKPLKGFTPMQIEELVRTNDKQLFALKKDDKGRLMIRANQGHRTGQQDIVRLSKTLAFLLRHGAEKLGFHFMPGGFLYVDQLLEQHKPLKGFTLEQIKELVRTNDKQRFYLQEDDEGRLMIRANQGHTTVVEGLDLSPVYDSSEVQMVVHGTYYQAWDQIQNTGLSRMNRNHIHFAAGMPGESGVISGMRKSCEVVIEIDLEKALKARIPFFRSANNVILSPGNEQGFIPPTFFKRVFDRHSGEDLMPSDFMRSNSSSSQNTSLPCVQGSAEGWSLQSSLKRMIEESEESEDECKHKKRRVDVLRSEKAKYKKEGSSSKYGTLQYKKERKNENERDIARQMRAQDEKEDISKSHDAKSKERIVQVRREDEKEVGETSKYRSGKWKEKQRKIKIEIPAAWKRTNEGNKKTT